MTSGFTIFCEENNYFCNNDSLMTFFKCAEFPILIALENPNANVMVNNQKHNFLFKGKHEFLSKGR